MWLVTTNGHTSKILITGKHPGDAGTLGSIRARTGHLPKDTPELVRNVGRHAAANHVPLANIIVRQREEQAKPMDLRLSGHQSRF